MLTGPAVDDTPHSSCRSRLTDGDGPHQSPTHHTTSTYTPRAMGDRSSASPSPRKEDRPEATQHIDYSVTDS